SSVITSRIGLARVPRFPLTHTLDESPRARTAPPPRWGESMRPAFAGKPLGRAYLAWEQQGNRAIRAGRWKLVAKAKNPWELYDMEADPVELSDFAAEPRRPGGAGGRDSGQL